MTRPPQRPEGALIKRALDRLDLSIKAAAPRVDLSDTRLRHYIAGSEPLGAGHFREVRAQARILARIAARLDITPEELEKADRADAAEVLRDRIERARRLAGQVPAKDARAQIEWIIQQPWSPEDKQLVMEQIPGLPTEKEGRAAG